MSIAEAPQSVPIAPDSGSTLTPYRFTIEQYCRLGETGILSPADRVELIEGQVMRMNPLGTRHAVVTNQIDQLIEQLLPPGWHIRLQQPVSWGENEPLPDLAVVRGKNLDYLDRHPGRKDVGLLIEVSDSTLAYDRKVKRPLYASAGIFEYWIVNLVDQQVEVHRQPEPAQGESAASYAKPEVIDRNGKVNLALGDQSLAQIKTSDLLL